MDLRELLLSSWQRIQPRSSSPSLRSLNFKLSLRKLRSFSRCRNLQAITSQSPNSFNPIPIVLSISLPFSARYSVKTLATSEAHRSTRNTPKSLRSAQRIYSSPSPRNHKSTSSSIEGATSYAFRRYEPRRSRLQNSVDTLASRNFETRFPTSVSPLRSRYVLTTEPYPACAATDKPSQSDRTLPSLWFARRFANHRDSAHYQAARIQPRASTH